jgi:hypothetical protein
MSSRGRSRSRTYGRLAGWSPFALWQQPWPDIWHAVSESANIPLIVIGLGFVVWLFLTKRRREALLVLLMLAAVTAGSEGIKQLVGRVRPSGTGDGIPRVVFRYPSGHVLEVLSILGIIAVRFWRSSRATWLRLALVIVVSIEVVLAGVARLALNTHFPSDALAGLLGDHADEASSKCAQLVLDHCPIPEPPHQAPERLPPSGLHCHRPRRGLSLHPDLLQHELGRRADHGRTRRQLIAHARTRVPLVDGAATFVGRSWAQHDGPS